MNEELFEKYFLGTLDKAEAEKLKNLLEHNDAVRVEFARYSMERAMLVRSAGKLAGLRGAAFQRTFEAVPPQLVSAWSFRRITAFAASLLFIGGIAVGLYYMRYPTVARLEGVTGEVFVTYGDTTKKARAGQRLISGMQIETRGRHSLAAFYLKDRSWITLPGDGKLVISAREGQKELHLLVGRFEANFQKQPAGKPLLIITPQSRSEVLGTSVKVETSPTVTRLEVVEGRVWIKRLSDGKSAEVKTRQAVSAGDANSNMNTERFYWADRFSGGEGGGRAVDRACYGEQAVRQIKARFRGGE